MTMVMYVRLETHTLVHFNEENSISVVPIGRLTTRDDGKILVTWSDKK